MKIRSSGEERCVGGEEKKLEGRRRRGAKIGLVG